jgi:dimethylamine/trimethylamine dehydrogenase
VLPDGPVLLFDDDAFYIGTVLTDVLRAASREVIYVTPDDTIASWSVNTHEYRHIQKRLREIDVRIVTGHNLLEVDAEGARLGCVYTGREQRVACGSILLITSRLPDDELQQALTSRQHEWRDARLESVTAIGDCHAPGLIAHAVYAGHRYAQELDVPFEGEVRFRRRADWPTG